MLAQTRQVFVKAWQRVGDLGAGLGHADQVFVQRLVEPSIAGGVGEQGVADWHLDPIRVAVEAGIVVVGQHQGQARKVHDKRIGQPSVLWATVGAGQQLEQPRGDA